MTVFSSRYTYEGNETTETTIVRVGGTVDATGASQSRKITTTANVNWLRPFNAEPYSIWNPTAGADVTVSVYGTINDGVLPRNDDVWMDVEYLTLSSQTGPTTLDGSSSNVTLSNGDLTVTHSNTTVGGAFGSDFLNAGKVYFEIAVQVSTTSSNSSGLILSSGTLADGVSSTFVGVSQAPSSNVYANSTTILANLGTTSVGDVFGYAVDFSNHIFWARRNGGNWNASGTADPATGVDGFTFAAGAYAPLIRFFTGGSGNVQTANFGATAYAYAAPSGFDNWVTPPAPLGKIVTTTKSDILAADAAVNSDSSTWNGVPSLTWFDPNANTVAESAVTNNNLTVTRIAVVVSSYGGARSLDYKTTGKYYFEFTTRAVIGFTFGVGILNTAGDYQFCNNGQNCVLVVSATGGIHSNNVNTGKIVNGTLAVVGDVASFAVDLTARLAWCRRNGGNWNGESISLQNPATGVGGVTIGTGSFAPAIGFGPGTVGNSMSGNFGQSAYAFTAPSGFGDWPATWLPFKLTKTLSAPQPGMAGLIDVRMRAGKPSAAYYIDPIVELSAGAGGTTNAAVLHRSSRNTYEGSETTETSIVRTGGAVNSTGQAQSRKIVTTANSQWLRPFIAEPYAIWNATTGANVTVTVCGAVSSGSLPLNDEIWMNVEYLASVVGSNTKLLLGFNGANGTTGTPGMDDESVYLRGTATVAGNANIDTSQFKFGASSLLLDGSGDYLTFPTSSDWAFGASQFTIECWVRYNTVADAAFLSQWDSSIGLACWMFSRTAASGLSFNFYDSAPLLQTVASAWTPVANTWYHVAVDRDASGIVRIYVDGVMLNKATLLQSFQVSSKALSIGRADHPTPRYLNGWIDEVRIANGVARYGSDSGFAVPTSAFTRGTLEPVGTVGKIVTTTKANVLASGTSVASDSSTWSTPHTTLDGTALSTTVSNGGLTATHTTSTGNSGAISTATALAGKYYFESTIGAWTNASNCVGVMSPTAGFNLAIINATEAVCMYQGGNVWHNSGGYSSGGNSLTAGDVVCAAIDLDAKLAWFRKNGGNWNWNASYNPATGVGGLAFIITGNVVVPCALFSGGLNNNVTMNFGQSAYAYTPPSGFLSWDTSWTPFKLTTTLSSPQPGQAGYIEARVRVGKASTIYYVDPMVTLS